jgi:hypothetical protein
MPFQVIVHEGRDEEVGMVVAIVHVQPQRNADLRAGFLQQPVTQPVIQEPDNVGR